MLVIAGEKDYQIGLQPQRDLAARLPDGHLVVIEGAGHFPHLDEPELFAETVLSFFPEVP